MSSHSARKTTARTFQDPGSEREPAQVFLVQGLRAVKKAAFRSWGFNLGVYKVFSASVGATGRGNLLFVDVHTGPFFPGLHCYSVIVKGRIIPCS